MSECKSCGAEIAWVRMESGKMMPVNLDAEVIDDKGEKIVVCKPHWANCPGRDKFRAKKEGDASLVFGNSRFYPAGRRIKE